MPSSCLAYHSASDENAIISDWYREELVAIVFCKWFDLRYVGNGKCILWGPSCAYMSLLIIENVHVSL